jgi:lysophospholipase L1-like esterase
MTLSSSVRRILGPFLVLSALLLWSGCEDGSLNAPDIQDGAEQDTALFGSYVALGNSITAGFQSAGISRQTQSAAFPVLLAEQMNTPFGIPALNPPGCPPPIESIPPQPPSTPCALRSSSASSVNNVAVPGASLSDVLSNTGPNSSPNPLTQFILGGRTQIEAALDRNPSFVTAWIGNNDVLAAANAGAPALATSTPDFAQRYTEMATRLSSDAPVQGAVLVGVADVTAVPGLVPGAVYLGLAQQIGNQLPDNFSVSQNCAPNDQGGQGSTTEISFLFALNQLNLARLNPNQQFELSCAGDAPGALTPDERQQLSDQAQAYNDIIASIANTNDWAFFNPNDAFAALQAAGEIPPQPDFSSDQPFGPFFSLDGIHPSAATHRLVAAQLVQVINETYDTNLSPPENAPSLPSAGAQ